MGGWICAGLLGLAAVAWIMLDHVPRIRMSVEERRLRRQLTERGRFLDWTQVAEHLRQGQGTLIVQHLSPKGPIREWWVEEDLVSHPPVPLPRLVRAPVPVEQVDALRAHARVCAALVDVESGAAALTVVPVPLLVTWDPRTFVTVDLGEGLMTAIVLVTGRKLAEKYPAGKVVTLVCWAEDPFIAVGDAEAVFLGDGA
jgi:hypothetical protein